MKETVYAIYIAGSAGKEMQEVASANLIPGKGIEGDRYYNGTGTFSEQLKDKPHAEITLIQKEAIDAFNAEFNQNHAYSDLRRNIVTIGVSLNDLIGEEFCIGDVTLKGIKLCEPCKHLAETVNTLFLPHMIGRSGLRAQVLSSGKIHKGDSISSEAMVL